MATCRASPSRCSRRRAARAASTRTPTWGDCRRSRSTGGSERRASSTRRRASPARAREGTGLMGGRRCRRGRREAQRAGAAPRRHRYRVGSRASPTASYEGEDPSGSLFWGRPRFREKKAEPILAHIIL
eukprot:485478-Prymnesium_polylepis.1